MSETTPASTPVPCVVCGAEVTPTAEGRIPAHQSRAGFRCPGSHERHLPTPANAGRDGDQAPGSSAHPAWVEGVAARPSASLVAWGVALVFGGAALTWLVAGWPGDGADSQSGRELLLTLGMTAFLVGAALLGVGVTRLAAKADVAYQRSDRSAGAAGPAPEQDDT